MSKSKEFRVTGRLVLFVILGFFTVTIGVNALFIHLALTTFPGVEADRVYAQSQNYNALLAQRSVQRSRGWTAAIGAERQAGDVDIVVEMRDANDAPVTGLVMAGLARRPRTDALSYPLAFEEVAAGRYLARVADLEPGAWRIDMRTAFRDGAPFEAVREVFVR